MITFDTALRVDIDDETFINEAKRRFFPDQIFDKSDLEEWALKNGFVKE